MSHAPHIMTAFGTQDGQLLVGGQPLATLATRVGSTPFFAYDRRLLTERVELLRAHLPPKIELSYAIKANPMPAVVQHLAGITDRFDVASGSELGTALDTTTPATRISFAGPGKTTDEIRQAVAAGATIELESVGEARRVAAAGEALGLTPRVAIRVNPDFQVKGSGMRMGGGPQQFGVDAERVPSLVAEIEERGIPVRGFHVFAGSQNLDASILAEAQHRTAELVVRLAESCSQPISYANLGGGFGIPYFPGERALDLAAVGTSLHDVVDSILEPRLPQAHLVIELGRFIVGECGIYVTRVVDRKESRGTTFLVVDGGLHHHLAASGNFGQVIRRNYPIAIGNRMEHPSDGSATVVGCSCTPLDLLGDQVDLPTAEVDDLVVVFQSGAYGLTASPTGFLSHTNAREVLV